MILNYDIEERNKGSICLFINVVLSAEFIKLK